MMLSFLVTVHNETDCLDKLLCQLVNYKNEQGDCEIVVLDDFSDNVETLKLFEKYNNDISIFKHNLNKQFGKHKQAGNEVCKGSYIFQIDADEYVSDIFLNNIKFLLNENSSVDLFMVPRVNTIIGLKDEHIRRWGWRLSQIPGVSDVVINWPDYQFRLYRNCENIKWERDLHELIVGYNTVTHLPSDDSTWALFHPKTIEKQEQQNMFYINNFSPELNVRK